MSNAKNMTDQKSKSIIDYQKNHSSDNIPTLRFPEFIGEWERKKLGEVAEINPSNKTLPQTFIYIDLESVANGELLKENKIIKDEAPSRAQRILKENDVLFQMVRPYQMNNLFFNKKGDYVASTGYAQIRTLQNSMYVFQYLHFQKFVDKVIERCTGTSYPAINSTDLSNIEIAFPTLPEQSKIAEFFTAIDKKIAQLKTKKQLLQQYKKGVMQQLFSSEAGFSGLKDEQDFDTTNPTILQSSKSRFRQDDGSEFPKWEKKKLGEVLIKNSNKNKGQKYSLVQSVSNKHGFINQDEMFEDRRVASKDTSNYYVIEKGHFAYNPSRIDVGSLAYKFDDEISTISPLYISFKANQEYLTDEFLLNWFSIEEFLMQMNNSFEGSVRNTLSYESLVRMEISIPSLPEQTKIANFLSSIDEKINRTETQIGQTQAYKKGLLQKMFV